jgi:hypothetical protein
MIGRMLGGIAMLGLFMVFFGEVAWMADRWRSARENAFGTQEATTVLERMAKRVGESYERDHKLCGSSLVESPHPLAQFERGIGENTERLVDEEVRRNTGFHCLGIQLGASRGIFGESYYPRNGYTYESDGTRFVLRGFRSYLYDPNGVIPRYEVRGEIREGRLFVDPTTYEVAPGGDSFLGHPDRPVY